ncbi:MAG: antitoxin [Bifidobacteriaceae bacterium]|nr:antitoxin [Bifidobacteriaceae bacterium]
MATLTVRNVPEETRQALAARARAANRSMEAEVRLVLEAAVRPPDRVKLGSLLSRIGAETGGLDMEDVRGAEISEPVSFG